MKEKMNLNFCFKGKRTYIHGTDIFTKLTENHCGSKKIDIAFHGITINNMTFSTDKPENEEVKVTFRALHDGKKIKYFGIENGLTVDCRYEYFEDRIVDSSTVDIVEESILLNRHTEYSFIEHIVAMNKSLMETLYPEVNGKWYFTRLQLSESINLSDCKSLKLILKSNFQFKLTKTVIFVNEKEVGFIYFSLVQKEF